MEQVLSMNKTEKNPKILVICSTLDLDLPYGATPMIWQLLKAFFEVGCDVLVVPYRGRAFRSLWWRCYQNPSRIEGELFSKTNLNKKNPQINRSRLKNQFIPKTIHYAILPKWKKLLSKIKKNEKNVDAIMVVGIPMNQITGLATFARELFSCPILYYELDVPTSLPKYGGFSFNYFEGADLGEYDIILSPSEGVVKDLLELGANRIEFVHFGVDPDLFFPISIKQDIDVFFYGTSDYNREESCRMLISKPSEKLKANFVVSGINFEVNLSKAKKIPMIPFNKWRNYACASKINLNIPRENHAKTYATSTSRPFELAAMGCCIISSPYNGMEKWFDIGKEIFLANSFSEAIDLYNWLLADESARRNAGKKARQRVLSEHTFKHRARQLWNIVNSLS
jgi:spore maturation protein CgeB